MKYFTAKIYTKHESYKNINNMHFSLAVQKGVKTVL